MGPAGRPRFALAALVSPHSLRLTAQNPLAWNVVMGLLAAFVAYGRYALRPLADPPDFRRHQETARDDEIRGSGSNRPEGGASAQSVSEHSTFATPARRLASVAFARGCSDVGGERLSIEGFMARNPSRSTTESSQGDVRSGPRPSATWRPPIRPTIRSHRDADISTSCLPPARTNGPSRVRLKAGRSSSGA